MQIPLFRTLVILNFFVFGPTDVQQCYSVLVISRYSVNEGRCWFKYQFTDHQFHVTGLVTEPGAKTMRFSLWGNTLPSPEWQVITVDFEKVLAKACKLII